VRGDRGVRMGKGGVEEAWGGGVGGGEGVGGGGGG